MKNLLTIVTFILIAFASTLSIGCASAGTMVEQSAVEQIERGKTTKAEVLALLGPPMSNSLMGDGREMMIWSYTYAQAKTASFIPVVGIFAGGTEMDMTTFQVIFDENDIVEDYLWSQGQIESRMGR